MNYTEKKAKALEIIKKAIEDGSLEKAYIKNIEEIEEMSYDEYLEEGGTEFSSDISDYKDIGVVMSGDDRRMAIGVYDEMMIVVEDDKIIGLRYVYEAGNVEMMFGGKIACISGHEDVVLFDFESKTFDSVYTR